jgi:hypothetical protein
VCFCRERSLQCISVASMPQRRSTDGPLDQLPGGKILATYVRGAFGGPLVHSPGISTRHLVPSGAKESSVRPPSSKGISSRIMLVPKPDRLGARAGGPPVSCHSMRSRSSDSFCSHCHRTDTRPLRLESAPYFAALVTSSCSTIATGGTASGIRVTSGPSNAVLPLMAQGANSSRTRSVRLTPCQLPCRSSACVRAIDCIRPSRALRNSSIESPRGCVGQRQKRRRVYSSHGDRVRQ